MHKCIDYLGCKYGNIMLYSQDNDLKYERCNDCGIIWRSADSMHITKLYEQEYFDSKSYEKRRNHKVKKSGWLLDLSAIYRTEKRRILEIGCSTGYTLEASKIRGISHLGIDISNYAVNFCKSIGLNASNSSLADLKQKPEKFDLIFMQHVLEHFENPFLILKDCNDLLNKNGLLQILVPNSNYYKAAKNKSKHRFYSKKGVGSEHFVNFNYQNIQKVLAVCGFETVQKNYPVFIRKNDSLEFFVNRLFRRSLHFFNADQEILVIAKKI